MAQVPDVPPIPGVPEDLILVINDRLRGIDLRGDSIDRTARGALEIAEAGAVYCPNVAPIASGAARCRVTYDPQGDVMFWRFEGTVTFHTDGDPAHPEHEYSLTREIRILAFLNSTPDIEYPVGEIAPPAAGAGDVVKAFETEPQKIPNQSDEAWSLRFRAINTSGTETPDAPTISGTDLIRRGDPGATVTGDAPHVSNFVVANPLGYDATNERMEIPIGVQPPADASNWKQFRVYLQRSDDGGGAYANYYDLFGPVTSDWLDSDGWFRLIYVLDQTLFPAGAATFRFRAVSTDSNGKENSKTASGTPVVDRAVGAPGTGITDTAFVLNLNNAETKIANISETFGIAGVQVKSTLSSYDNRKVVMSDDGIRFLDSDNSYGAAWLYYRIPASGFDYSTFALYNNGSATILLDGSDGSIDVGSIAVGGSEVINSSKQFVGAGVLCTAYGVAAGGFNPYVGGVQYTGATGSITNIVNNVVKGQVLLRFNAGDLEYKIGAGSWTPIGSSGYSVLADFSYGEATLAYYGGAVV